MCYIEHFKVQFSKEGPINHPSYSSSREKVFRGHRQAGSMPSKRQSISVIYGHSIAA